MVAQARGVTFKRTDDGAVYPSDLGAALNSLIDVARWLGFRTTADGPSLSYFRALKRERRAIFKRARRSAKGSA